MEGPWRCPLGSSFSCLLAGSRRVAKQGGLQCQQWVTGPRMTLLCPRPNSRTRHTREQSGPSRSNFTGNQNEQPRADPWELPCILELRCRERSCQVLDKLWGRIKSTKLKDMVNVLFSPVNPLFNTVTKAPAKENPPERLKYTFPPGIARTVTTCLRLLFADQLAAAVQDVKLGVEAAVW